MKVPIDIKYILIVISLFYTNLCQTITTQIPLLNMTATAPANIYQQNLVVGDKLIAELTWLNTSVSTTYVNIYLYANSLNLFSTMTYTNKSEVIDNLTRKIQHSITQSNKYYIRVYSQLPIGYKLTIWVNNIRKGVYYGYANSYTQITTVSFSLANMNSCMFKINITGAPYLKQLSVFDSAMISDRTLLSMPDITNTTYYTRTGSNQYIYILKIYHYLQQATNYTNITINITTYNTTTQRCYSLCAADALAVYPRTNNMCGCSSGRVIGVNQTCGINCSQIRNTVGQNGNQECICKDGYNWNNIGTYCVINCTAIRYAVSVSGSTDKCTCNSSALVNNSAYIQLAWNQTYSYCNINCSSINNSIFIANTPLSCSCISPFVWNTTSYTCNINCSSINYTSGIVSGSLTQCTCKTGYVWNSINRQCAINCTTIAYNNGSIVGVVDACACASGYVWNTTTVRCVIKCSSISNALYVKDYTIDTCLCANYYLWNTTSTSGTTTNTYYGRCNINCTAISYTTTLNTDTSCNCIANFIWDTSQYKCIINCSSILYTNGSVTSTIDQCACAVGYKWDSLSRRCLLNCSSIPYATTLVANTVNTCACNISTFVWDSSQLKCIINCTAITYGLALKPSTIDQCTCNNTNITFDTLSYKCKLNCSTILYASVLVTDSIDICVCNTKFVWNSSIKKCIINCTSIANSTGSLANTIDVCTCNSNGYLWSPTLIKCMSMASICGTSDIPYSLNSTPNTTINTCECNSSVDVNISYIWNSTYKKCVLNCTIIPYAIVLSNYTYNACTCKPGFYWNSTSLQCIINCTLIAYTRSLSPNSYDACTCVNYYQWNSTTYTCIINCASVQSYNDTYAYRMYPILRQTDTCTLCTAVQCLICSTYNPQYCHICKKPYSLYDNNNGTCYRCQSDLCTKCSQANTSICLQCQQRSYLSTDKICILCSQGCLTCSSATNCVICQNGRSLANGKCSACQVFGCASCFITSTQCSVCNPGYYLNTTTNLCQLCGEGCLTCNKNACTSVKSGYVLTTDSTVVRCAVGCRYCTNSKPQVCIQCQPKYYINNGLCYSCAKGCQNCTNSTSCSNCSLSYQLNQGSCTKCADQCLTCSSADTTKCVSCRQGYKLVNNGCSILACEEGCLQCDPANTTICLQCNYGYTLNNNTKQCVQCLKSCSGTCDSSNISTCLRCNRAFQMIDYKCVRCPENCVKCFNGNCLECLQGYKIVKNNTNNINRLICTPQCVFPCKNCTATSCLECATGFNLDNGKCVFNSSCNPTCKYCPLTTQRDSASGNCTSCPTNCSTCLRGVCIQCQDGFYLDSSSSGTPTCSACPSKCQTCYNNQTCKICGVGYIKQIIDQNTGMKKPYYNYIQQNNQCIACSSNCLTCGVNPAICMSCFEGETLMGEKCVSGYAVSFACQINMNYQQFVSSDQPQKFMQSLATTAGVPVDQVTIVSIKQGSTVINGAILASSQNQANSIQSTMASDPEIGIYEVLSFGSTVSYGTTDQSVSLKKKQQEVKPVQQSNSNQLNIFPIIGGVGGGIFVIIIIIIVVYKCKNKNSAKIGDQSNLEEKQKRQKDDLDYIQDSTYVPRSNNRLNKANNAKSQKRAKFVKSKKNSKALQINSLQSSDRY